MPKKRIDILSTDAAELTSLLADASDATWHPYGEMMKQDGISESEAIARWLNDMNDPKNTIPEGIHPKEAADRYRTFLRKVRAKVTSEQVPVVIVGFGHSGSLGQMHHEAKGGVATAEESPQFCEIFKFDENENFTGRKSIQL